MDKKDLRIIYLGTPDFAVEAFRRLVEEGYNIVAAVTMPDKPVGRHQNRLQPSPVKEYALSQGIPLLQPENLKSPEFIEELRALQADLQIVVAFRMLPEVVWKMPRLGTFNIHASLLPQYRGAAPINWAIINGDKETGLTTFFLQHNIDTGDIIDRVRIPISPDATFGTLHDELMALSGTLAIKTVQSILDCTIQSTPQSEFIGSEPLRPAPKIFKETCRINLALPLDEAYDFIRGLSPMPGAWAVLESGETKQDLKIFGAKKILANHAYEPGQILSDGKKNIDVALKGGFLRLTEVQLSGKKRLSAAAFLCGYKIQGNEKLT